jgi:hypothetical protein
MRYVCCLMRYVCCYACATAYAKHILHMRFACSSMAAVLDAYATACASQTLPHTLRLRCRMRSRMRVSCATACAGGLGYQGEARRRSRTREPAGANSISLACFARRALLAASLLYYCSNAVVKSVMQQGLSRECRRTLHPVQRDREQRESIIS